MTVPIALWGWIPLTLLLFLLYPARKAILISFFGAWMFLPMYTYSFSGMPGCNKLTVTCLGCVLGIMVFDKCRIVLIRPAWYDLFALMFCLSPLFGSLNGGYGLYEGVTGVVGVVITWGVPYLIGRAYFGESKSIEYLCKAIFIAGLIYVPFCLYEIRMSPQLHSKIYGFMQHEFSQTRRWGGYRPMVFMQHGLAVGVFMASGVIVGIWMWRSRLNLRLWDIPGEVLVMILTVTMILCKSTGAVLMSVLCLGTVFVTRWTGLKVFLICLALAGPTYMVLRVSGAWDGMSLVNLAGVISEQREGSVYTRINSENAIIPKAMSKPIFGHGRWKSSLRDSSGVIVQKDEEGRDVIPDAYWIILLASRGLLGVATFTCQMVLPMILLVWLCPTRRLLGPQLAPALILSVVCVFFLLDCIQNAMLSMVYPVIAGALLSYCDVLRSRNKSTGYVNVGVETSFSSLVKDG